MASSLAFGVQALALVDTKFPIWYPYYGSWFIAMLFEVVLLIIQSASHYPTSLADLSCVAIQGLRMGTFLVLTFLYFGLPHNKKDCTSGDPEQQPLLRKSLGSISSSGGLAANGNTYVSTTDATAQDLDTAEDCEAVSEDVWLAEEQEAKDKMLKRLKHDGNWFTYVKGFSVRGLPSFCATC